ETPKSKLRSVLPGRASAVARGALAAGTRTRRAPATTVGNGAATRCACWAAATVFTVVCNTNGASLVTCGRICSTARSRGCSRNTEVWGATAVICGGSARPTGFIVRPVVNGASNGGDERKLIRDRTLKGASPPGGSPAPVRNSLNALVPDSSCALAPSSCVEVRLV